MSVIERTHGVKAPYTLLVCGDSAEHYSSAFIDNNNKSVKSARILKLCMRYAYRVPH